MLQQLRSRRTFRRIDCETKFYEVKILALQIRDSLLEGNDILDIGDPTIGLEIRVLVESANLLFGQSIVPEGLDDICEGLKIRVSRKQWIAADQFRYHASQGPDIDRFVIGFRSNKEFWCSVPSSRDILSHVRSLFDYVSALAKVTNLEDKY